MEEEKRRPGERATGRLGDKEKFQTSNIWNFELLTFWKDWRLNLAGMQTCY